jgi:hypothetical protein
VEENELDRKWKNLRVSQSSVRIDLEDTKRALQFAQECLYNWNPNVTS